MAMTAGSVTVAADLSRSGSGMALDLYDDVFKPADATLQGFPRAAKLAALQGAATLATALAGTLVSYITSNAEVETVITTADGDLQQTAGLVDTEPPAANRTLSQPGTIS